MPLAPLPIDAVLPEVVAALRTAGAAVLRAPTGAGKTTRAPPAVLDAGLAGRGAIVVLQPRRLRPAHLPGEWPSSAAGDWATKSAITCDSTAP